MRYKLIWCDSTSFMEEDNENVKAEKFEEIIKGRYYIEPTKIEITGNGGEWVDFDCEYEFEAEDLEKAKECVEKFRNECGRAFDVFTLLDEKRNKVYTEEQEADEPLEVLEN